MCSFCVLLCCNMRLQQVKMMMMMMRSQLLKTVSLVSRQMSSSAAIPKAAFLSSTEVQQRVVSVLASLPQVDADKLTASSHLYQDLKLDSMQREHALENIRREFCVDVPASLLSVSQI